MCPRSAAAPVAITGMACLCAAGATPEAVWHSIRTGHRALIPGSARGDLALPYPLFGIAPESFPGERKDSAADVMCLGTHLVGEVLARASLDETALDDAGLVLSTAAGSALHFIRAYAAARSGEPVVTSDRDDYFLSNLALGIPYDFGGPRLTITNACTSGADAIGIAVDMIRQEQCPCMVCGGVDLLSLVPHTGFARLMIYDEEPCRPFDLSRKGLNLGEGGAVLVLESLEHAASRGAEVYGYVLGYGNAADAHHFTAPHPEGRGLSDAIRRALEEAGLTSADLAFVNAHGTATPDNDKVEGPTLAGLLPGVPMWASKGGTGHMLAAAGALEAVLTLEALRHGTVPASIGFSTADPAVKASPTSVEQATRTPFAMSTSLGFGGSNAALILGARPGKEDA